MDNRVLSKDLQVFSGSEGGAPRSGEEPTKSENLGNATKLRTPPPQKIVNHSGLIVDKATGECLKTGKLSTQEAIALATQARFDLQDTARKTLYGYHGKVPPKNVKGFDVHHRTCTCTRFLLKTTKLQLVHSKKFNSASFKGVMTCANSKTCPVCAEVINQRKANEMRTAFNQREALGLNVTMLTFTVPHSAGDKIEELTGKISDALARFWRGTPAKKFKEQYGIVGNIRSFEVMHGDNGWHPHFHILVFSKIPLPVTLGANGKPVEPKNRFVKLVNQDIDWLWMFTRWQTVCQAAGLSQPKKHGFDSQNGDAASSYITKFGSNDEILKTTKTGKNITWDMADEATKGNTKIGKNGKSLSPWGILSKISETEDIDEREKYKMLFIYYARALHGKSLLKWSRGLRPIFGLDEKEATEEQILQQEIEKCDYLCDLTPREWKYILANNLRGVIKQVASHGDSDAIARILFPLYSGTFEDFLLSFNSRKDGTAAVSDDHAEWDLFEEKSNGDQVAILEKINPVTPVKPRENIQEIEESLIEINEESLVSLCIDSFNKKLLAKSKDKQTVYDDLFSSEYLEKCKNKIKSK